MNIRQFRYVLVLAQNGSFSKAAGELGVSQPSLSQYIKRLESELGVVLFERSPTSVRLTDAGKVYIEAGRKILDTEKQMESRFSDIREFKTGTVTVGIGPTRSQYLMPEIVKRFSKLYPGMQVVVEERYLDELADDAERGLFDLCIATLPVDEKIFRYELMMTEEVILALPKGSALAKKLSASAEKAKERLYHAIDIKLIDGADYVSLGEGKPTQLILNGFCEEYGISVRSAALCRSVQTQYGFVKAGIGCALIPSSVVKYTDDSAVDCFSVKQFIPKREMAVIWRKEQHLSKAVLDLKKIITSV